MRVHQRDPRSGLALGPAITRAAAFEQVVANWSPELGSRRWAGATAQSPSLANLLDPYPHKPLGARRQWARARKPGTTFLQRLRQVLVWSVGPGNGGATPRPMIPSSGGFQSIGLYVVAEGVRDLADGIHIYDHTRNCLCHVRGEIPRHVSTQLRRDRGESVHCVLVGDLDRLSGDARSAIASASWTPE